MTPQQSRTMRLLSTLGLTHRPAAAFLCLLLLVDVLLVGIHVVRKILGEPPGGPFDLAIDRSYAEIINGVKMIWSAAMLILLTVRDRAPVFLIGALAFLSMLFDDWFMFHEQFGSAFSEANPHMGIFAVHTGELLWIFGIAILFGAFGLLTYVYSPVEARRVCIVLLALFAVLGVFAVGLDAAHHMFLDLLSFNVPFAPVEDGGELLAMTAMTGFLFAVAFTAHRPPLAGRLARIAAMPHRR
ncbi:MAG: hypothetical protein FWF75_00920 [Propionibacteriaceae bacterium]|nr:hypothetical protein [Propionibacteriaceae bacterium]